MLVFGGNGFVGSHICQTAVENGLRVVSVSRSGRVPEKLAQAGVVAAKGDIWDPASYRELLQQGVRGVVSCVGAFGSQEHMERECGGANVVAAEECSTHSGVELFAFVSAHRYKHPPPFMAGYYRGKAQAEEAIQQQFGAARSLVLRCPFIYGRRQLGPVWVPLQMIGLPLELLGWSAAARKAVAVAPWLDLLLTPPVAATAIARLVVASMQSGTPRGVLDVFEMQAALERMKT
ncbi:MAG: NAD(P)H-binding protein [archaeon]|nr:NAD(P)H-binding protein [archaeon]